MHPKTKLRVIMAATTAAFAFTGFQFFVLLLIKGWRIYPLELAVAVAVGGLLGWAASPKTTGKCVQIGTITGLVLGYTLIILLDKKV